MLEQIGKYEVKRVLGKGATGTVYLASDLATYVTGQMIMVNGGDVM